MLDLDHSCWPWSFEEWLAWRAFVKARSCSWGFLLQNYFIIIFQQNIFVNSKHLPIESDSQKKLKSSVIIKCVVSHVATSFKNVKQENVLIAWLLCCLQMSLVLFWVSQYFSLLQWICQILRRVNQKLLLWINRWESSIWPWSLLWWLYFSVSGVSFLLSSTQYPFCLTASPLLWVLV